MRGSSDAWYPFCPRTPLWYWIEAMTPTGCGAAVARWTLGCWAVSRAIAVCIDQRLLPPARKAAHAKMGPNCNRKIRQRMVSQMACGKGPMRKVVRRKSSGGSRTASVGKQTSCAFSATGATRDAQIVGSFGHPYQGSTLSRKIERPQKRRTRQEGSALSGHSENTEVASTCSILTALLTFQLQFFLFNGTSREVLGGSFSLNVKLET